VRDIRIFVIAPKIRNRKLQILKRDATASPNTEPPSEKVDSDFDPHFSLSDHSY
jgi:hypothetical protein